MARRKHWKWAILALFPLLLLIFSYPLWVYDISPLRKENPGKTAFMEFREKEWKRKGQPIKIYHVWIPLAKISPYLLKAVLISEDDKFWHHEGFDYEGMRRAIEKDLEAGKFKFGGSTVSQQLARNLFLSPEKSLTRKFQEALITWKMERVLTKRRILELYLNVVEWGQGIFGAEAAARRYFGKPSFSLTAEEAARLAAVLPNPRKYSPVGNQGFVVKRAELIYRIMVKRGVVNEPDTDTLTGPSMPR